MKRYELELTNYKSTKTSEYFTSRKQAYNFLMSKMFLQNKYRSATLLDTTTGEIWLTIGYRARDNYYLRRR